MLFILCFHKTTNNCVKECKKIKNKSKKDMQLWFVSYIDRMEIEITETRSMNAVSSCGTLVWNFFGVSPSPQQIYSLRTDTEPVM